MHRRRAALSLSLMLFASILFEGAARAAPLNDDFASAEVIKGSTTIGTSTVGATREPSEPNHAGDPGGASIWYAYTASGDGEVTISTAGSDFDTLLAVYFGTTLPQLSTIVANDDVASGNLTSEVTFQATEGTPYHIAIDGKAGATGNVVLTFSTALPACDLIGTMGIDHLTGTAADEIVCGLGGNDTLAGGPGDDELIGSDGDDVITPGPGDDVVSGGRGRDTVSYKDAPGVVVALSEGRSRGEGRDQLTGIEDVIGSKSADRLTGDGGPNAINGGGGGDRLVGLGGDDELKGAGGNDRFEPGSGDDFVSGSHGRDSISFADSRAVSIDLAFGRSIGQGTDEIKGIEDVVGSPKRDTIRGSGAKNSISGGGGADTINGYGGNDKLIGGGGADLIFGGGGKDHISGGSGRDTCYPKACERKAAYDDWLPVVNFYRSAVDLERVMEDPALSSGDVKHARYIVKTDQAGHFEDPNNRFYTQEGAIAGQSSNVFWSTSTANPDRKPIDFWMAGPFHAIGMINPGLALVGYGVYREGSSPGYRMAAALDIFGGLQAPTAQPNYPIMWPGDGSKVPLTSYPGNETPDPLTMCPGYRAPTGLPILLVFDRRPNLHSALIRRSGSTLSACAYEGARYRNPDAGLQSIGRAVLGNSIVLIPRAPLHRGASYDVVVDANGGTYRWQFKISG